MFKRITLDAFGIVFRNLETVFKVCGAWFAVQFVLALVANMFATDDPQAISAAAIIANLMLFVAAILSWPSIAVAWHRFALFGEEPGLINLRFGRLELRFLTKSVVLALICMGMLLPVVLLLAFLGVLENNVVLSTGIIFCACLFAGQIIMRFNLVLPAAAVERPLGFGEAFRLGEGLGLPMILATLALSIPFAALSTLLMIAVTLIGGGLPIILIQMKVLILNLLLQIIITVLGISVITAGYRIAMERTAQPRP